MATYGEATIVIRADASRVEKDIDRQASAGVRRAGKSLAKSLSTEFLGETKSLGKQMSSTLSTSLSDGFRDLPVLDDAKKRLTAVSEAASSVQASMWRAQSSTKGFTKDVSKLSILEGTAAKMQSLSDAAGSVHSNMRDALAPTRDLAESLGDSASESGKLKSELSGLSGAVDSVRDRTEKAASATRKRSSATREAEAEDKNLHKTLGKVFGSLTSVGTKVVALSAALAAAAPHAAVLATTALSMGSGMLAAQLGVAAFTAAAKPQLADVADAMTAYEATQENTGQTTKQIDAETKKFKASLKEMPPVVKEFTLDLISLKNEYKDWSKDLAQDVFKPFTKGINVARTILPLLSPLVRGVAQELDKFAATVLKASKSDTAFTWIADFSAAASTSLRDVLQIISNLFVGILAILHAFLPESEKVTGGLVSMSEAFRDWALALEGSKGFADFLAQGEKASPVLKNLGAALLQLLKAMEPFAGSTLIIVNAMAQLIANTPAPVIAALAQAFIGATVASRAYAPVAAAVKGAIDIGGTAIKAGKGVGQFTTGLFSAKYAASEASGAMGSLGGTVRSTGAALVSATSSAVQWAATQTTMALATAATTTKLVIQQTIMKVIHGATLAWTAAQWLLNAAMTANPIGIVIAVIVALGAALVLAYKKSETFRNVVTTVWNAIKAAIGVVVSWVTATVVPALSSAWSAIWSALKTVASSISSAWNSVWSTLKTVGSWVVNTLSPWFKTFQATLEFVFKAIIILIKAWWELSVKPTFAAAMAGIKLLGSVFKWLYDNAVKPSWNAIKSFIQSTWTAIKAVWDSSIKPALKTLGAAFKGLYDNYIKPAWSSTKSFIQSTWNSIKSIWESSIKPALKTLGSAFRAMYDNTIKPVWSGIKSTISSAWTGIKPVFSAMKTGVAAVKSAFGAARDGIRTAWNSLEGIAKKPIKFMIGTVLNKGLIKAFNWLGSKVGGPHIDNIPLPFAKGGVLPGYTPGRDVHQFYSPTGGLLALSGGEAIMRPEFTKQVGGRKGVARLNGLARTGQLTGDFAKGGVLGHGSGSGRVHSYLGGGVIDWIKKQGSNAFDWVEDKTSAIWQAFKNPLQYLKSKVPTMTGSGVVKDLAGAARSKLVDSSVTKIKDMFAKFNKAYGAGGGVKFAKMKAWINDHLGIPYLWGGTGPRYDCSGFTQAASRAGGVSIPRVAKAQQSSSKRIAGNSVRGGDLGFNGSPAHHVMMAMGGGKWAQAPHTGDVTKISTLGTGSFTNFGRTFRQGGTWTPPVFDRGGILPTGISAVRNNTGRPEGLVPAEGLQTGDTYISIKLSLEDLAQLSTLDEFLKMLDRSRVDRRRTAKSGTVSA